MQANVKGDGSGVQFNAGTSAFPAVAWQNENAVNSLTYVRDVEGDKALNTNDGVTLTDLGLGTVPILHTGKMKIGSSSAGDSYLYGHISEFLIYGDFVINADETKLLAGE